MKNSITEYFESEFLQLVKKICAVVDYPTDQEHIDAVIYFEKITEHPDGSDLLCYPKKEGDDTPENIVKIVKEWRFSQNLPCFKDQE